MTSDLLLFYVVYCEYDYETAHVIPTKTRLLIFDYFCNVFASRNRIRTSRVSQKVNLSYMKKPIAVIKFVVT